MEKNLDSLILQSKNAEEESLNQKYKEELKVQILALSSELSKRKDEFVSKLELACKQPSADTWRDLAFDWACDPSSIDGAFDFPKGMIVKGTPINSVPISSSYTEIRLALDGNLNVHDIVTNFRVPFGSIANCVEGLGKPALELFGPRSEKIKLFEPSVSNMLNESFENFFEEFYENYDAFKFKYVPSFFNHKNEYPPYNLKSELVITVVRSDIVSIFLADNKDRLSMLREKNEIRKELGGAFVRDNSDEKISKRIEEIYRKRKSKSLFKWLGIY